MHSRRLVLLAALSAGAVISLAACGGADERDTDRSAQRPQTADTRTVMDFDSSAAIVPGSGGAKGATANGAELFTRCAACHQSTGLGMPGAYPPLAGSEWLNGNSAVPIRIVLHGLQGPITVKGASFNNAMTPFADQLTDDEIAAIISYERSSWGNASSKVTAEQVKAIRDSTKSQTAPWKPADLQGMISAK